MKIRFMYSLAGALVVSLVIFSGCQQTNTVVPANSTAAVDGNTIGDLAEIIAFGQIQIRGVGLVTGLAGTGSSECPAPLKSYLTSYIKTQLPKDSKISPESLIESKDTAVVNILGLLPAGTFKGEKFDIVISALSSSQTTSLEGGTLLAAELKQTGSLGQSRAMAIAAGPVFTEKDSSPLIGYALNGGSSLEDQQVLLKIKKPDYVIASVLRDKINSRFGDKTAIATSDNLINIKIPDEYRERKEYFLKLITNLPMDDSAQGRQKTIEERVSAIQLPQDREKGEYTLEGIGRPAVLKLLPLLDSNDTEIKISAAKVLLSMGDYKGYQPLADTALNGTGNLRFKAMDAVAWDARRRDASGIMARLLGDDDIDVKLRAYEHLRRFDDISISKRKIDSSSGDFDLERMVQGTRKIIWVSRSGDPRIALFGSPIYCEDNIFIQSSDGLLMVNSRESEKYVTIVRKDPRTGSVVNIQSSNELGIIISRMCQISQDKKVNGTNLSQRGLGASYSDMVKMVELMCEKGAVKAEFIYGPETELKKSLKFIEKQ